MNILPEEDQSTKPYDGGLIKNGKYYARVLKGGKGVFNKGNLKNGITTSNILDFTSNSWIYKTEGSTTIQYSKNQIESIWNGGSYIGITSYTKFSVDLTNIKTVTLKYNATASYDNTYSTTNFKMWFMINDIQNATLDPRNQTYTKSITNDNLGDNELVIDVSDLQGSYYIQIAPIGWSCIFTDLILE